MADKIVGVYDIKVDQAVKNLKKLLKEVKDVGDQGSIMMVDDKFSIWDLMHSNQEDDEILQQYGLQSSQSGAGAADPKAIDFQWHQRNFENALGALYKNETPAVDGKEGRRAVELICAIYESIKNNGTKITLQ